MGTFSAAGDTGTYRAAGDTGGNVADKYDNAMGRIVPLDVRAALQKVCSYCISFILLNCKYLHLHLPFDFGVGRAGFW